MSDAPKILIEDLVKAKAVPKAIEISDEMQELAKQAKRLLGYGGLLSHTAGGRLQAILENLEIEVLDPDAVFQYQLQFGAAVKSVPVRFLKPSTDFRVDDLLDSDEEEEDDDEESDDDDEPNLIRNARYRLSGSHWTRIPISQYKKAIPEFVIRKAVQLKKALSEVSLFVEELQKDPDPFLIAMFEEEGRTEEFYIEVWHEPGFEGRFVKASQPEEHRMKKWKKSRR